MWCTKCLNETACIQKTDKKMPKATNSVASRQRRKKVMNQTKGQFGRRKNVWTVSKECI